MSAVVPRPPTVAVYSWSQTGQLTQAAEAFLGPLVEAGWQVDRREVRPVEEFGFPWSVRRFVGLLPRSADPRSTVAVTVPAGGPAPDLVLFAFQVWYLAPSLPMRSVLAQHPELFRGHPVVGLVACRNMWYSAALAVRGQLTAAGARYAGTVAAVDPAPAGATFVTALRWMLTGRRDAFWVFPAAGVDATELARLRAVGADLAARATGGDEPADPGGSPGHGDLAQRVAETLRRTDAAPVVPAVAAADLIAGRLFRVWAAAARAGGSGWRQAVVLTAFTGWLAATVAVGLPFLVLARAVVGRRFDAAVARLLAPAVPRRAADPPVRPAVRVDAR